MPGLEVAVEQGKLKGCALTTSNGFVYNAYMGIPYAKPPVGELRFRDPQYPDKWDGVLEATVEGSENAQIDTLLGKGYRGTEDSLFLNVYVPNGTQDDAKLPVMFWIHGGAFIMGSGSREFYGPDNLIQANVIVVTINYRLGMLGFLCCNNKEVPGNAGLKDQAFALRWVNKNIHKFGGDPTNITIFGESAGGASVDFQMMSPMSKGLFQKAIVQSGASTCIWAMQRNPEQNVFGLAKDLGFESNDLDATVKFLRQIPTEELVKAGTKNVFGSEMGNFLPILEQNISGVESFITTCPIELMKSGNYNRVPCITGFTSQEGVISLMTENSPIKDFSKVKSLADTEFPLGDFLKVTSPTLDEKAVKIMIDKIEKFYFGNANEPLEGFIDVMSDLFFIRNIFRNINLQRKFDPLYVYMLSYNGGLNLFRILTTYPYKGASHADDLGYLFKPNIGELPAEIKIPEVTDADILTIKRMVALWTNFAKYGNPTPKVSGDIITTIWEPVMAGDEIKCLEIGKEMKMISNPFVERLKFWENLMK